MNSGDLQNISAWRFRQEIIVDNTKCRDSLTDYQVEISLNSVNFDFSRAQPNGEDLRFTDTDGSTLIDHWIQYYDIQSKTAIVWVKIPDIPAAGTRSIYMYYGNPSVVSASNGSNTFEFFDDCEGGEASDRWEAAFGSPAFSYMPYAAEFQKPGGVWHASGAVSDVAPSGKVYGGAHATYCAWTRPMAVYVPSEDKTFFAFGNADNSPTVCYYDHSSGSFADAIVVGVNSDMDAHKNPHMLIDEAGYIYIFHGSHCTPTFVKRSAHPYDISAWTSRADIDVPTSYPQPWQLKAGEITVLLRKGGTHDAAQIYVRSTDGGESWEGPVYIVTPPPNTGVYAVSIAEMGEYPRKVHIAWSWTKGGHWYERYHVHYAYSDDGGTTWRRSDGTPYALPISESDSDMIHRSPISERGVWLKDIQLDSEGNPYILFLDADIATYESRWKLARLSGGEWEIYDITTSDHMYDSGALVILADDDFRIYGSTTASQPREDGGEIEEWKSVDKGETWTNTKHVTSGSKYSHNHVKTVFNHQKGDFRVFWNYGDAMVPPETRDVDLYYYGEKQPAARRMSLSYADSDVAGKFLKISQPEAVSSAIKVKDFRLSNVAIDARARTGLPEKQHPMLCLRVGDGSFYSAGLAHGKATIYKCLDKLVVHTRGSTPKGSTVRFQFRDWSFRACNSDLRFVVDGYELVNTTDSDISDGSVGARVYKSTLYLDDIRVRKYVFPSPEIVFRTAEDMQGK